MRACPLPNHVHLLVTPQVAGGLSWLMRAAGQRYVQAYNRRHSRTGPLWNDRFRTSLVDSEEYLFVCYRYIEMNPVRAGMVAGPHLYVWSSFHANGLGLPSLLVRPRDEYLALGDTPDARQAAYRRIFDIPLKPEELERVRSAANANNPLGSDEFLAAVEARFGVKARPGKPGRRAKPQEEEPEADRAPSPV